MLVRLEHSKNALSPIFVTPSGIVMLVRLEQPSNALSPMLVTFLPSITAGIVTSLSLPTYLVILTVPPLSNEYS